MPLIGKKYHWTYHPIACSLVKHIPGNPHVRPLNDRPSNAIHNMVQVSQLLNCNSRLSKIRSHRQPHQSSKLILGDAEMTDMDTSIPYKLPRYGPESIPGRRPLPNILRLGSIQHIKNIIEYFIAVIIIVNSSKTASIWATRNSEIKSPSLGLLPRIPRIEHIRLAIPCEALEQHPSKISRRPEPSVIPFIVDTPWPSRHDPCQCTDQIVVGQSLGN